MIKLEYELKLVKFVGSEFYQLSTSAQQLDQIKGKTFRVIDVSGPKPDDPWKRRTVKVEMTGD